MNINEFLNSVAQNPSRNYKLDQLRLHEDNGILREVVRLALDPFTQFYIRKIPAYIRSNKETNSLEFALSQMYRWSMREVTGNAAINALGNLLSTLETDDAKVIERIIDKSLDCGIHKSTANAVWMGLIKEYPVMLCSPFEQKLADKITFPALVQKKEDGMRFNAIVREGNCEFRSRNGKEIQLLGNLEEEFIKLAGTIDCVFDGELLVMNSDGSTFADRQTGNGILNRATHGTISQNQAALVHATIWDVIPYIYFIDGYCQVPYKTRFQTLQNMQQINRIHLVESTTVWDMEEANAKFKEYLDQGMEGIILKDLSGVWEDKRAKHQIKFKGELECDLKIVAVEEGTGKYAGMLGAIVCESSDGVVKVRVGSGFNDSQRETYWEQLLGKIVAIKYNSRSKNKSGEESLFLPIFIEIREDKDAADDSSLIA